MTTTSWTRYAALGDSITEGWCDPVLGASDGMAEPWFGWADRLALVLGARAAAEGRRLEYANLAVRGRRVRHVVDDQIPRALELRADLVSIFIGGNDILSFAADPDALAAQLDAGVARLRADGVDVLLANGFDPGFAPMLKPVRGRAAVFSSHLTSIAARRGCRLLDVWGVTGSADASFWSEDRMHPSRRGHLALTSAAAAALGLPEPTPTEPIELGEPVRLPTTVWLRRHALPWAGRKLRGVSSGDGRGPKTPEPIPVPAAAPEVVAAHVPSSPEPVAIR